jgi:hypothetical protein
LAQCYDWRIADSIASLGAQWWGVSINAITCLLMTIQFMIFFLCTAHSWRLRGFLLSSNGQELTGG